MERLGLLLKQRLVRIAGGILLEQMLRPSIVLRRRRHNIVIGGGLFNLALRRIPARQSLELGLDDIELGLELSRFGVVVLP